jgi:hypothetical protein
MSCPDQPPGYGHRHLFTVQSDPHYGITAGTAGNRQVLLAGTADGILSIFFDGDGNLVETVLTAFSGRGDPERDFTRWEEQLGFTAQPIRIMRFSIPEYGIGIADLPAGMRECLEHPRRFTEKERGMILEDIQTWLSTGQFVLQWREEFYMNSRGQVISS